MQHTKITALNPVSFSEERRKVAILTDAIILCTEYRGSSISCIHTATEWGGEGRGQEGRGMILKNFPDELVFSGSSFNLFPTQSTYFRMCNNAKLV